jgi:hypothetical protein
MSRPATIQRASVPLSDPRIASIVNDMQAVYARTRDAGIAAGTRQGWLRGARWGFIAGLCWGCGLTAVGMWAVFL